MRRVAYWVRDLDGDLATVEQARAIDLRHRAAGDRLRRKLAEQLLNGPTERVGDNGARLVVRVRRTAVVQARQALADASREEIRSRRGPLAKLEEARAGPGERAQRHAPPQLLGAIKEQERREQQRRREEQRQVDRAHGGACDARAAAGQTQPSKRRISLQYRATRAPHVVDERMRRRANSHKRAIDGAPVDRRRRCRQIDVSVRLDERVSMHARLLVADGPEARHSIEREHKHWRRQHGHDDATHASLARALVSFVALVKVPLRTSVAAAI